MGRLPRIEFEGAVYHVISRGNRQEAIFLDDQDNCLFLDTVAEACGRTGWRVHAYVLMGNHYHLLLETPEANLVDGMRWLQGTYTKRFNIRHKQYGHLFQGRYKALMVGSDGDYFQTAGSYIHLNPARRKNFNPDSEKLADYPWSSYSLYLRPAARPEWLFVERILSAMGLSDDYSGRMRYRQYMQKRALEVAESGKAGDSGDAWEGLRSGWCFGSDAFRDQMVKALDGVMDGKRRDSFVGEESKRHDLLGAQRLLSKGLDRLGLTMADLETLKKSDPRKKVIAWWIRKNTSVKNEWISACLWMGSVTKLSSFVKEVEKTKDKKMNELKQRVKG